MIDFISMSSDSNGPQLKRLREHCALVGAEQSALKAPRISIVQKLGEFRSVTQAICLKGKFLNVKYIFTHACTKRRTS